MTTARLHLLLAGAVAILVVGALGGAAALAHDVKYDSRVTIKSPSAAVFKGRVFSEKASCEPHRTVKLYRETGGEDIFLEERETDEDGRWRVEFIGETRYYAKVTRRVRERPGHRHVCKRDRSPSILAGPPG